MREAIELVDYQILPDEGDQQAYKVRLLSGPWVGVEYKYGKVSLREDVENDTAHLAYDFDIVRAAPGAIFNLEAFGQHIGWILQSLITTLGAEESLQINVAETHDPSRDPDHTEFVEE